MFMRHVKAAVAIAAIALLASPLAAQNCLDDSSGLSFTSHLFGSQFGGSGAANGFGSSSFTIDPITGQGRVSLQTTGLGGTITGANLMRTGSNGSSQQVFSFTDQQNQFNDQGQFDRTFTISPALMNEILANPSNYSVSINTGEFPQGAIRGGLMSNQSFGGTFSGSTVVGGTGATNGGGFFTADIVPATSGSGSTLVYSFTPTGAGNNFSNLQLFQGQAGTNGTLFQSLSNNATLTNGRFTGSVPLTAQQAQQFLTNPSNFYVVAANSQFPQGAIRAQFGAIQNELFLPVAGSVQGAFGSQWQTNVQIFNASSSAPATVTVQMLPAGQANFATGALSASNAATITVPARGVSSFANALQSFFNVSNGIGAVRIISDQPIVATGRIFDNRGGNDGSTAQQIYAMSRCEAMTRGVLIGAANAGSNSSAAAARTNIGFFNPNATAVTVILTSGTMAGGNNMNAGANQTITLQPFQQMQQPLIGGSGSLFTSQQFGGGPVTFQASAPIFAYTSLTHNANGDTHVLFAKEDTSVRGTMAQSDIGGVLASASQAEIQQGNLAISRASSTAVRNFAQQMVTDHTASLAQMQTLFAGLGITTSQNATSNFLTTLSQQTLTNLNGLTGTNFDRAYMQAQVAMHQNVLLTIDQVLLPSAQNGQLQNFLQTQRAAIQMHLQQALQISAGL